MNIPKQINQQPINKNGLIPPEIPLQPLHTNHGLLIYAHTQNRWLEHPFILLLHAASDHNIVPRASVAELSLGGVKGVPRTMLSSWQKRDLSQSGVYVVTSEIEPLGNHCFFSRVTENQTNFRVNDDDNVKALNRFGTLDSYLAFERSHEISTLDERKEEGSRILVPFFFLKKRELVLSLKGGGSSSLKVMASPWLEWLLHHVTVTRICFNVERTSL